MWPRSRSGGWRRERSPGSGRVPYPDPGGTTANPRGSGPSGALHEDGLADTFDALGATTRADALRILADPAHGTYGVLAVALGTTGRILALGSIRPLAALGVLVAAHG